MSYLERIKELRIDNDKPQKEIAALLGVGQSYYSKQERGDKPFQIDQLIKIAEYYQIGRAHV